MGDRAIVYFKSGSSDAAPGVYLHWDGHKVKQLLEEAIPRMRSGDPGYSAARFCGVCHENIEGNRSLGLLCPPPDFEENTLKAGSHGDAGLFLVDVDTWEARCYGGYGFRLESGDSSMEIQLETAPG